MEDGLGLATEALLFVVITTLALPKKTREKNRASWFAAGVFSTQTRDCVPITEWILYRNQSISTFEPFYLMPRIIYTHISFLESERAMFGMLVHNNETFQAKMKNNPRGKIARAEVCLETIIHFTHPQASQWKMDRTFHIESKIEATMNYQKTVIQMKEPVHWCDPCANRPISLPTVWTHGKIRTPTYTKG